MKNTFIIILSFCFSASIAQVNTKTFSKTKWECKIGEGCISYYTFLNENSFEFYNCEMEEITYGNYYLDNNFLMIEERGTKDETENHFEPKLYKLSLENNYLKHLELSFWVDDKWVLSDFKFDEAYKYYKIDTK